MWNYMKRQGIDKVIQIPPHKKTEYLAYLMMWYFTPDQSEETTHNQQEKNHPTSTVDVGLKAKRGDDP